MNWLRKTAAVVVVMLIASSAWAQVRLDVGSKAPPLAVARWLKGERVAKFEPGKVYVVEFWASWCPPCRQTVPHLTELQKKYPEVVVIGVNAMERNATAGAQFVREMGEQMDYRVAVDMNRRMTRMWMEAAGQDGIPCAFVVDKEGAIAWIGHPLNLDKVLASLQAEGQGATNDGMLRVGSMAPALETGKWIKGEPVEGFEEGKVYVVEFWASWCGPCRQSVPHLTRLQKKYPAVTFIGQNVSERDPAAGERFMAEMGEQMDYRVVLDRADGTMGKSWLKAAGEDGIPCAFIVGKDGKIAWIGHPMEMESAVKRAAARPAAAKRNDE